MTVDVLIVGAGISGIGAAWHLQDKQPSKSYAILEARDAVGGTWDLFRYPGIRSDSDLHTFAYAFKPWTSDEAIADGHSILSYIRETAEENGIDRHIRFGHRVLRASWSSEDAVWTVEGERTDSGEPFAMKARWVFGACGYYRYDEGYTPELPGLESFGGEVIHPQHWPEGLDYAAKRVVVIGSGATAVTLVPAMAEDAAHVTMLQRSPSYVLPLPSRDGIAMGLRKALGERRAYTVIRWKNILLQAAFYRLCRRFPNRMRRFIRRVNTRSLPAGFPVDLHLNPRYDPWDQRLCIVPDGDLFDALADGKASIATDEIDTFTDRGVRLRSGADIEADVVVTATGLNLVALGGMQLAVDGREVRVPETVVYKGMMLSGVPNLALAIGYINASWTLKVDLACEYLCRLMAHLDATGHDACVAELPEAGVERRPLLDFAAGYVLRSIDAFPKQGTERPWRMPASYVQDFRYLRRTPLEDETLRFFSRGRRGDTRAPELRRAA